MHYFILGPSGSGKSYIAERLAGSINGLWLEADIWPPPRDGIGELSLRSEWDAFLRLEDAAAMFEEFDRRAKSVVLSLPGYPILNASHAKLAKDRARIIYLTG